MGTGISNIKMQNIEEIKAQAKEILEELLDAAKLQEGDIVVVGCSSSEVADKKIGTFSSEAVGKAIFDTVYAVLSERNLYLAAQCCEHLNRAIIIEKEAAGINRIPIVNVVPQLKAGGSFATAAYHGLKHPAAVEGIQAQAGMDIGDTLIGMHLAPVAVPVRTSGKKIGSAHVVCARTRAKCIGGVRAAYDAQLG